VKVSDVHIARPSDPGNRGEVPGQRPFWPDTVSGCDTLRSVDLLMEAAQHKFSVQADVLKHTEKQRGDLDREAVRDPSTTATRK
jgi:hypothetical protein